MPPRLESPLSFFFLFLFRFLSLFFRRNDPFLAFSRGSSQRAAQRQRNMYFSSNKDIFEAPKMNPVVVVEESVSVTRSMLIQ